MLFTTLYNACGISYVFNNYLRTYVLTYVLTYSTQLFREMYMYMHQQYTAYSVQCILAI